jgi:hypothetical protein
MTHLFGALSASKASIMVVFGVLGVLTVTGLELFRAWLGRKSPEDTVSPIYEIAATITLAFMVLVVLGGTDMVAEGKKFLNVSFVLFGVAGVAIIPMLLRRFRGGLPLTDESDIDEDELRRKDALDL